MSTVLVTGGAGYVGSHVVRSLLSAGYEPVVYDDLSQGHRKAVGDVELFVGDVGQTAKLERILRDHGVEWVIHLAGATSVEESTRDPEKYYVTNVLGGLSVLRAIRAAKARGMVFSSTAAVYGVPRKIPIEEDAPCDPINAYGGTKRQFEQALEDFRRSYGLAYASLRYFNAAGADSRGTLGEDHRPETHLIPRAILAAAGIGKALPIYGTSHPTPDGTAVRDYVHVSDLAEAHVTAMQALRPGQGEVLNLGGERGYSVKEVIKSVERVTGMKVPAEVVGPRAGDVPVLVASSARARRLLGWRLKFTSLDHIVESAWAWHSAHPRGYDDQEQKSST